MKKEAEKPVWRRELEGIVVSDKMDKTIVVEVVRVFRHPLLGKTIRRAKKYHVHDEQGTATVGDRVRMSECRPLSKRKHMTLSTVIESVSRKA